MCRANLLLLLLVPASASLRGVSNVTRVQDDIRELTLVFDDQKDNPFWSSEPASSDDDEILAAHPDAKKPKKKAKRAVAPTDSENPKCDQACTSGSEKARVECNLQCAKMQKKICGDKFDCHRACGNHIKQMKKDVKFENLCNEVHASVCDLGFEGPPEAISPHHDHQPPPSVEATPAPKIYSGSFVFCNLYPASYEFELVALKSREAKDGKTLTKLSYKQCDKIEMESLQSVGLRVNGKFSGKSLVIDKIPSVMLFGQWAFGNHQVEFNRYFAKGDGPVLCQGFPMWEKGSKDKGELVTFFRDGKKITSLRYKECFPTSIKNGEVLSAKIGGKQAGEYIVTGSPSSIVFGKAGDTTATAFEAWTDNQVGIY